MSKEEVEAEYEKATKNLHYLMSRGIYDGQEFNRTQKILLVLMEKLAGFEEE